MTTQDSTQEWKSPLCFRAQRLRLLPGFDPSVVEGSPKRHSSTRRLRFVDEEDFVDNGRSGQLLGKLQNQPPLRRQAARRSSADPTLEICILLRRGRATRKQLPWVCSCRAKRAFRNYLRALRG